MISPAASGCASPSRGRCISRATCVMFDEPTAALDERTGDMNLIRATLRALHGHTVVIVTHDARVAAHPARERRFRVYVADNER